MTDWATGLRWQKSGSEIYMPFKEVKSYIDNLNRQKFAGFNDWRLPTVEELASLIEQKQINGVLYIDRMFDSKQSRCLSSDMRFPGSPWYVYFNLGRFNWTDLDFEPYARAVRSIQ